MFWNRNTASENKNYRKTAPKITQNRITANPYAPLRAFSWARIVHKARHAVTLVYTSSVRQALKSYSAS